MNECVSPYEDKEALERLAALPDIRVVVSNTTEAGIALTGTEQREDRPADSFPGKLTQWLYARFRYFEGALDRGVVVLPVELIENNAGVLKALVCQLAEKWGLGEEFLKWLDASCRFCNTLVDRIVTGCPADAEALCDAWGYQDELLDACEPFALWVIECDQPEVIRDVLPLDKAGLPVVLTKDLTPYRERKVRILNGAHTASVLAAYLAGEEIVRGMMGDELLGRYVRRAVYDELAPTVSLAPDEVRRFADAVLERLDNPFIDHALLAIALNSVSKWRARVLPGVKRYREKTGALPRCLTFSWAALAAFYDEPIAQRADGTLEAKRGEDTYIVRDEAAVLDFFWQRRTLDNETRLREWAARRDFWGEDLNQITGFVAQALADRALIARCGMRAALEQVLLEA